MDVKSVGLSNKLEISFSFDDQDHGISYRVLDNHPLNHIQAQWNEYKEKHRGALLFYSLALPILLPSAKIIMSCPRPGSSFHEQPS